MSDLSQTPFLDSKARPVRAPQGTQLSCANWQIEAAYRMIQNNLDPAVAENPDELVVYGGIGKAARNWPCFDAILDSLRKLQPDETLLIQSGKPVGVFRTHEGAPRVLIANSNLVPKWATWEHFNELDRAGLMMYGQMTAGSWIYIGSQGIVQGTYETFVEAGRQHYNGDLAGRWDQARHRHGPDLGARHHQWLPADRLDGRAMASRAERRVTARQAEAGRRRVVRSARESDARVPRDGHPHRRLRQQPASGREGLRRRQCVRVSGFRARVHPPPLLPRRRAVP